MHNVIPYKVTSLPSPSLFPSQRILSCQKAGSILREARDRVVSLTADAKARVIACHVSVRALSSSCRKIIKCQGFFGNREKSGNLTAKTSSYWDEVIYLFFFSLWKYLMVDY